jgi:hypothetical protein
MQPDRAARKMSRKRDAAKHLRVRESNAPWREVGQHGNCYLEYASESSTAVSPSAFTLAPWSGGAQRTRKPERTFEPSGL